MANQRKSTIERDLLDLHQCVLLNNYYLKVLKPGCEQYAYQELLLADHLLQIAALEKQLEASCSKSSKH